MFIPLWAMPLSCPAKSYDLAALVLLAAFSLSWPAFATPQFWTDPNAQRDILGVNSIAYYTAIMNDINAIAFERRPLFGYLMWPLKWVYDVLFGLDDGDAALAAFRTVGAMPPLLVYVLARFHLRIVPSLVLGAFSATMLVVMFNHVAIDSYALTMAMGIAALIVATAFFRAVPDPIGKHPFLAGILTVVVTLAAGWVALTLLSVLLVFLLPRDGGGTQCPAGKRLGRSDRKRNGPALYRPLAAHTWESTRFRERWRRAISLPANLMSADAWLNVLISDFIAAFAYPGSALPGSRFPGVTNVEDWMGPVRAHAMSNSWAFLLGVSVLALMAMSWKAMGRPTHLPICWSRSGSRSAPPRRSS